MRKVLIFLIYFIFVPVTYGQTTNTEKILNDSEKKYNLIFKTQPLSDVLKVLTQESGLNIVLPDGMTETVNLNLRDVTLKNALEVLLLSRGYNYKIDGNIVRVFKESAEKKPLLIEVIPLKFANAQTVGSMLSNMFTINNIQINVPTNSLIIKADSEVISQIKKMIENLDVKTRQVLIETRIVNATESFSRDLGIQWGGFYTSKDGNFNIFGTSQGGTYGTSVTGQNFAVNLPLQTQPFGNLGITIGSLGSNRRLDLALQMAEEKGKAKIVSTPKILTLDNKRANIRSGATLRIRSIPLGSTVTTTSASITEITTGVELGVTPQISGDSDIMLTLDVTQSEPNYARTVENIPEIRDQKATTTILLKDGETVVLGGLYKTVEGETERKIPFLADIPLIGWLFKSKTKEKRNEELIIFITPKIVKEEIIQTTANKVNTE
ncbi:MAG: type IV pilus secretin PilQ [Proteobacteria bacterium]|nr:type IV pilus secretin PilQ [Pseudomonadota bacterium]